MSLMVGEEVIVPRIWRQRRCIVARVDDESDRDYQRKHGLPPRDASVRVIGRDGTAGIFCFPVRADDCVRVDGNLYRPVRWHQ